MLQNSNSLFYQVGLAFNGKGGTYYKENKNVIVVGPDGSGFGSDDKIYKFEYIETSAAIGWKSHNKSNKSDLSGFYFSLGVSPSILVSQSLKETYADDESATRETDTDIARPFNAFIFTEGSIAIGGKIGFRIYIRGFYTPINSFKDSKIDDINYKSGMTGLSFGISSLLATSRRK